MYAIAIIGDALGFALGWFPGASLIINPMTGLGLYMVGSHEGINIYSSDHIGLTVPLFAAELMPFVSMLPLWTMRVWIAKRMSKQAGR